MKRIIASLIVGTIASACGGAAITPSDIASRPPSAATATSRTGMQTATYCTDGGKPLAMDITLPTPKPPAAAPAVLYVHGGGWEHGDRRGGGFLDQVRPQLNAKGFIVASIDYRLAPADPWPAQIVDTKCAVRYVRVNAATYGIDPQRMGAWGGSAGDLVSLMGTADASAGFDVSQWSDTSSRLQAVVDLFGPVDLTAGGWNLDPTKVITDVFGGTPGTSTDTLAHASPVHWITPDDPPFLILQGDADQTVPAAQSHELAAKLQAAGVPATLVMVKGGPHGLGSRTEQPSPAELVTQIVEFFVRTLGTAA